MKTLFSLVALVSVVGAGTVAAGSSSAQLTVGVTVVRSCTVDLRHTAGVPASMPRLTCAAGAQSALRMSESVRPSTTAASVDNGRRVVTLNF